jgi:predicted DNA-binding protein (UPF0251 family)
MANQYTKVAVDLEQIKTLYLSGMSQSEVAEQIGISQKLVWHRLKELKIKSRPAIKRNQKREKNSSWKGGDVSYSAFHFRLQALRGKPKKCEVCGTTDDKKHYDWANLTGQYDNPDDYKRMCRSCHWKYDKKHLNFKGGKPDAR